MSDIDTIYQRLQGKWVMLSAAWQEAQAYWHDQRAEVFRREYWTPWEDQLPHFLTLLRALDQNCDSARSSAESR